MGRADNRRTPKALRRKAQRRKKMRIKAKITGGKGKATDKKTVRARPAGAAATPTVVAKPAPRKATAKETTPTT